MAAPHGGPGRIAQLGSRAEAHARRTLRVWRRLSPERRLAAGSCLALVFSLFLPWYQETVIATTRRGHLQTARVTTTGWGAFSFVEAAVLLIAAAVLTLLFQRAEGRGFHVPGGDGWVVTAAGGWTCLLVVWRIFDKQGTASHGQLATTWGIEWGILVALAVGGLLTYAGAQIRAARAPEPALPSEKPRAHADVEPPASAPARPPAPVNRPTGPRAPARPRVVRVGPAGRRERPVGWLSAPRADAGTHNRPARAPVDGAAEASTITPPGDAGSR